MVDRSDEKTFGWQESLIDSITVESILSELRLEKLYKLAGERSLTVECPFNCSLEELWRG